jgi:hypothetical protein
VSLHPSSVLCSTAALLIPRRHRHSGTPPTRPGSRAEQLTSPCIIPDATPAFASSATSPPSPRLPAGEHRPTSALAPSLGHGRPGVRSSPYEPS